MLRDGEVIVADARPVPLELDPPAPVALSDAQTASLRSGFARHPFPMCFGCGPEREPGDGLRLFPGSVTGRNVIACPWRPNAALANENGLVRTEFVWAALDCPTAFAPTSFEVATSRPGSTARTTSPPRRAPSAAMRGMDV